MLIALRLLAKILLVFGIRCLVAIVNVIEADGYDFNGCKLKDCLTCDSVSSLTDSSVFTIGLFSVLKVL